MGIGQYDSDFSRLLEISSAIARDFPEGLVYIGGIAVYLHAINSKTARCFAETTHYGDFYISLADMGDLRDMEEITPNRRLSKHQLRKGGFDFDIYTERQSAIIVPYNQVIAYAQQYENLRVASLEHLLVLKLEAYRDRCESAKGQKDAKDIIRIGMIARENQDEFRRDLLTAYLHDEHIALLERVARGPEFLSLTRGNAKEAKESRVAFQDFVQNAIS